MSERRDWYGARWRGGAVVHWTIRATSDAVLAALKSMLREADGSVCTEEAIEAAGWRIVPVRVEWNDE